MEPITIALIGKALWDLFGDPILKATQKEYGQKSLDLIKEGFQRLPFNKKENEVIEAQVIEAVEKKTITDKQSLIDFLERNDTFIQALVQYQKGKTSKQVVDSFKEISGSTIKVSGDDKLIDGSFKDISNSQIEI